jgi:hypothetical protein
MEYWTGYLTRSLKNGKDIGNFYAGKELALKGPHHAAAKNKMGQTQRPHVKFLGSLRFL